jgi:hypothetical protein
VIPRQDRWAQGLLSHLTNESRDWDIVCRAMPRAARDLSQRVSTGNQLISASPEALALFLIAAPAAVSIWSGWIVLRQLSRLGLVHLLPRIYGTACVSTITLPVGADAYGA